MSKKLTESFTREQLELVAQQAAKLAMSGMFQPPNLDSGIDSASTDTFGEENPKVSTRRIQESTNSFPAFLSQMVRIMTMILKKLADRHRLQAL